MSFFPFGCSPKLYAKDELPCPMASWTVLSLSRLALLEELIKADQSAVSPQIRGRRDIPGFILLYFVHKWT
jgi:hypothetical protein